jgi:replicative DNA helicase
VSEVDNMFRPMGERLDNEAEERVELGKKAVQYGVTFLDDYLLGLLPRDLVILGAPSGLGKTELALSIAIQNAMAGRPSHYFALEAEPRELERRRKYQLVSSEARRRNLPGVERLRYRTWMLGMCEDVVGGLNAWADRKICEEFNSLYTFYRGKNFTAEDLGRQILAIHEQTTLIVVDHLHYVDVREDDNENRGLHETVKICRDIVLRIGKPIILVVHLRKKDRKERAIMPELDDIHGSSNIPKIATQVIFLEHALDVEAPKWFLSPTYMAIRKDRLEGAPRMVALMMFNKITKTYSREYTLGRLRGLTKWEEVPLTDAPSWATHHRALTEPTPAPTEVQS